jgi:hypothetical protein
MPQTYCHSEGGADPNLTVLTYPESYNSWNAAAIHAYIHQEEEIPRIFEEREKRAVFEICSIAFHHN